MNRLAPPAIGGLLAVLAAMFIVHYQARDLEDDLLPPARIASPAAPGRPAETAATGAPALAATILARPLFSPSRRPAAAGSAGPATLPRLSAVLVSSRGKSVIFAAPDPRQDKPVVLAEGGQIAGYTVQSISHGQVSLLGPNGIEVLRPVADHSASPAFSLPDQAPQLTHLTPIGAPPGPR